VQKPVHVTKVSIPQLAYFSDYGHQQTGSQNTTVGMVIGYGLDGWGSIPYFSLLHRVQAGTGATQPPIQWVSGYLPWVKVASGGGT
jgi:hypothetical protein